MVVNTRKHLDMKSGFHMTSGKNNNNNHEPPPCGIRGARIGLAFSKITTQ